MITKFKIFEGTKYSNDFYNAVVNQNIPLIKNYLNEGDININQVNDYGESIMHRVVHKESFNDKVFDLIMTKSDEINFNIQSYECGDTPLLLAAFWDMDYCVDELLKIESVDWTIKDNDGKVFLDLLSDKHRERIAKLYPKKYEFYKKIQKKKDFNL